MVAFNLVTQGCIWQVGCGEKINVWGTPWLQNDPVAYVQSPMVEGFEDMRVSSLIYNHA